ncbi:MAG: hypothetical protein Q8P84_08895, partial [Deltaproteobacteria bacterium]|nr:hypothetical protein [Deltaproteobacteria bacterium]
KLSAAISKDGEKFVVAMEKECGSGGSNVFYQMFTRWSGRSDGSYVEGAPQYMGQRGNKWAPVVMRNSRNDFAIAWLFEEKNETITSSTRRVFGYRIRYRVQKAYFKIIKANGVTTVGPSRFVDTWWRGGSGGPDFENPRVMNEEMEGRLKGSGFGEDFCASFRRVLKDNYGGRIYSDKSELICRRLNGALSMRTAPPFSLDTPSLTSGNNSLITVAPQTSGKLRIEMINPDLHGVWVFHTETQNWQESIGSVAALNYNESLKVVLSNQFDNAFSVLYSLDDSLEMKLERDHLVGGAMGPLKKAVYAAGADRRIIGVWLEDGGQAYGMVGSVE